MSRHTRSLPPDYFAARYAADPDPWRFATSDYERDKYAATLAALPRPAYARALEVGCSIGVFTRQLAPLCADLLALDVAEAALAQARTRCADQGHVRFRNARVPQDWPEGTFDLILFSEVPYYLDAHDLARLCARVRTALRPGADCVLVHWTGDTHYPLTGDEAAEGFVTGMRGVLRPVHRAQADAYRLDVLTAVPEPGEPPGVPA